MASFRTPVTNDKEFELPKAGWAVARLAQVIDLGTQMDHVHAKETHYVRFVWELGAMRRQDGKPHLVFSRYTHSHHPKSRLRKDLESWYGRAFDTKALNEAGGFDLAKLVNRAAFVNITHSDSNDTTYANITSIGPLPIQMECPQLSTPSFVFSLAEFDQALFDKLSDNTKKTIMQSGEYRVMTGEIADPRARGAVPSGNEPDDDLPYTVGPAAGASTRIPAARSGGNFSDMDDDIPF